MFRGFTGLARRTLRVASVASGSGFARGHGGPVNAFALANRMNLLNVDRRWSGLTPQEIDAMFANRKAQMKRDKELAEKLQREEAAKKAKKAWGGKKPPLTGNYALEAAKNAEQRKDLGVSSQRKGAHVGGYLNKKQNEALQNLKKTVKKIVVSPDPPKKKAVALDPSNKKVELGPRTGHDLQKLLKKSKKKKRKMENLESICNPGEEDNQPLCLISPGSSFSSAPVRVQTNALKTNVWKDTWEGARKANLALVGWELFPYSRGGIEYVIVFSVNHALTLYAKIHLDDVDGDTLNSVKVGMKDNVGDEAQWGIKYSKAQLKDEGEKEDVGVNLWDLLKAVQAVEEVAAEGDFGYDQGAALRERNYANRKCWYFTRRSGKSPPNPPMGNAAWKPREQSIPLRAIPT